MPAPSNNKTAERTVRRWRRIFLGIYVVTVVAAGVLIFLSVVAVLCGVYHEPVKGRRISAKADVQVEIRDCHRRLASLLTELHKETFSLQAQALRFKTDPSTEWRNWSRDWRHRWRSLDYRCRLGDLAGKGVNPAIDKMADIHMALDELQLSYTGVVENFVERYVERLRRLRADVSSVRAMIDRKRSSEGKAGSSQDPGATP